MVAILILLLRLFLEFITYFLENWLINISKQYCGSQKPAVWHSAHDVLELVESKRCVIVLLTERFFRRSVLRESSCLHYLLPDKRDSAITDRLRHAKTFTSFPIRTEKHFASHLYRTVWIFM